jgi:hypothetical protein
MVNALSYRNNTNISNGRQWIMFVLYINVGVSHRYDSNICFSYGSNDYFTLVDDIRSKDGYITITGSTPIVRCTVPEYRIRIRCSDDVQEVPRPPDDESLAGYFWSLLDVIPDSLDLIHRLWRLFWSVINGISSTVGGDTCVTITVTTFETHLKYGKSRQTESNQIKLMKSIVKEQLSYILINLILFIPSHK